MYKTIFITEKSIKFSCTRYGNLQIIPQIVLVDDFIANYLKALTYRKDVFLLGDLNCNMLKDIPEPRALKGLC